MKRLIPILALGAALVGCALFTGCSTSNAPFGQAFVRTAASTAVMVGTETHPEITPYLKTATHVVCAAANSTNVVPAQIVADLAAAGVSTNEISRIVVNSVINLYTTVYAYYGDSIKNQVILIGYLHALCDGMNDGLPPEAAAARAPSAVKPKKALPPHLH